MAGFPSPAEQYLEPPLDLNELLIKRPAATYFVRVEGILTAQHLRDASDDVLRSLGGVTLLRVAMELRGISCHEERDYDTDPDSVSCSRSLFPARVLNKT